MTLRISATSPYARKVRIAVSVLGLEDRVKVSLADTYDPDDQIRTENPLGKVPTLLLDDGRSIYDSFVILTFLNDLTAARRSFQGAPHALTCLSLTLSRQE
jgi:glutathione S-transferase